MHPHFAGRTGDADQQKELRDFVERVGLQPTPQIDRFWFKSVYFREPGGVLFELATDGPGFTVDEDQEDLGTSLVLPPPWNTSAKRSGPPCRRSKPPRLRA